ncbi:MAG TPA: reverse transcriptase domain-containing protein [Pyrinomonadaceae bacterium]|nr:reverse transcriptase domain-containing protein [Pyrinomonadaceae bacterium]
MHKRPTPFDVLTEPTSLLRAWRRVRANRGAAGVDQVTLAEFERDLQANLEALSARLREGRYYPMPVRTVQMRKAAGGTRTLGILTVEDRIVQRAALDALEPLFEPSFLECSYGFRPNRSVELAVERVLAYRAGGDAYVVDADIADCFGTLDHDLLMRLVGARVRDKRMLALIRMWLDAGLVLPATPRADEQGGAGVLERATDYVGGSMDAAIMHLLDERGYGAYGYGGYADYQAATTQDEAGAEGGEACDPAEEARRRARKEAFKRLGRDGVLLMLTYANRARRLLSPATLLLTGAAALGVVAYPAAARAVRRRLGARAAGAVQGGSLSPLLSNAYLHEFDVAMTRAGLHLVRYADDFVILCRGEAEAREALGLAARKLAEMRLRVNPAKTRVTRFDAGFVFLGYRFGGGASPASPPVVPVAPVARLEESSGLAGHVRTGLSAAARAGKFAKRQGGKGLSKLGALVRKRRQGGEEE